MPPAFPEGGGVFVQPADGTGPSQAQPLPETDLADLTARFAASGGPGLSSELSMELALEIVLHEIVEQTCLATGATGETVWLPHVDYDVARALWPSGFHEATPAVSAIVPIPSAARPPNAWPFPALSLGAP